MKKGSILPIALMAFAIVAFLVLVNFAVTRPAGNQNAANTSLGTSPSLPDEKCAIYNRGDGPAVKYCATCGNGVCETGETCTSTTATEYITQDCGSLYCLQDCPTSPTAGWRTYTNTTYGYSIQYPPDWPVDSKNAAAVTVGSVPSEPGPGSLSVNAYPSKTVAQRVTELKANYIDGCTSETASQISGLDGKSLQCRGAFAGEYHEFTLVAQGSATYELTFVSGSTTTDPTMKQILATFTFTSPTTGWKTYTSHSLGITIKYPADMENTADDSDPKDFGISRLNDARQIIYEINTTVDRGFSYNNEIQGLKGVWKNFKQTSILVGGKDAIRISGFQDNFDEPDNYLEKVYIPMDNWTLIFWFEEFNAYATTNDIGVFTAFLQTVSYQTPTTNWSTYPNPYVTPQLISIGYPSSLHLERNNEQNRRGSYETVNVLPQSSAPYVQEIQLFSRESIEQFNNKCAVTNTPCFFGDYPSVSRFDGFSKNLQKNIAFQDYAITLLNYRTYGVKNIPAIGDGGLIREYNTMIGETLITLWVYMKSADDNNQADALIKQWKISYAGF